MAKYNFKTTLSISGIQKVIDELEHYKNITLSNKLDDFIRELAQEGIFVAKTSIDPSFQPYITFGYRSGSTGKGEFVGISQPLFKQWYDSQGNISGSYNIDPIAMAEFGAGIFAENNPWGIGGMRGSLGKNGNRLTWAWYDQNGNMLFSNNDPTIVPTRPMYNALLEMIDKYQSVARKVFK